ncbi:phospho-acceptor domain-containing protein [Lentzea atacamensis]|uniref:histidine kinase n=1 Tax=Lentzea atacamensis TaxID=531938 RepID=A0ABX9EBB2_9PSEU|nr:substrate-binding domain-containing protein [Lentzea atacamensis]RAS67268.1 phospho-acceptor domain-containing protein [Lentzea atacamensis]
MRPTIGMITAGPLIELTGEQWQGVSDGAAANGCDLICFTGTELAHPDHHKRQANAVYDLIAPDRIDALVIWTTRISQQISEEAMREFAGRYAPIPIVSVEAHLADWPTVLMDNRRGMDQAVSHLIEVHGHQRIGFVRGPLAHAGAQDRYQGYVDALTRHGLQVEPELVTTPAPSWDPAAAADAVAKILDGAAAPPDAFAAANDEFALGVVTAVQEAGLGTPEDVAVVGYDNHTCIRSNDLGYQASARQSSGGVHRRVNIDAGTPALTTVRAPFYEMGRRAADLASALVRGEPVPALEIIPTELVVRRSCGCIPSGNGGSAPAHGNLDVPEHDTAEAVAANLRQGLGPKSAVLPDGWAERLTGLFLDAGRPGGSGGDFLELFAEHLRDSARAGCAAQSWWAPLFYLRRFALERGTDAGAIEDLWLRVQLMVSDVVERERTFEHLLHERQDQTVREAGQRLIVSRDVAELTGALVAELPRLGIPGCHVMTYESTREWSRPLMSYENGELRQDRTALSFRSTRLTPHRIDRPEPGSFVAAALFGLEEQLGFVLFEVGPMPGWVYEAIQQQLAGALRGIRMLERERQALAEAEQARRSLELAHAELEDRVRERTAALVDEIAERERLETRLRHAQKMEAIGRLTGGIAHDFNNILTVINGNSEAFLRRSSPDDPRRPEIEDIRHAGERAANLTHQLLAFTRQQVLNPERVDLNAAITKVRAMLTTLIGEDVELTLDLPEHVSHVWADAGQLEQILFNLAANARDAMPDGGVLHVGTDDVFLDACHAGRIVGVRPGHYVALVVSDTGTGMDESVQAQIFEPYFTTKPAGKGTGLGLATVFGIVQQSGGQIHLTSSPGAGTTVSVYLPRAQTSTAPLPRATPRKSPHSGSETILLVEDDSQVRAVTRRLLERSGYAVIEARDGLQALKHVDTHDDIDLIVTDVVMPKMGGPELAATVQRIRPGLPVLYVSGYTTEEKLDDAAVLLAKPYAEADLLDLVRRLLDRGC